MGPRLQVLGRQIAEQQQQIVHVVGVPQRRFAQLEQIALDAGDGVGVEQFAQLGFAQEAA